MKAEDLLESIGEADERFVAEAKQKRKTLPQRLILWAGAAACLCLCIVIGGIAISNRDEGKTVNNKGTEDAAYFGGSEQKYVRTHPSAGMQKAALTLAVYPETSRMPQETDYIVNGIFDDVGFNSDYETYIRKLRLIRERTENAVISDEFSRKSIQMFLRSAGDKNLVYSPVNIYMALSLLAEITDGESRAEILDVLGSADLTELRTNANNIWRRNYSDDGVLTSILGSSVWLRSDGTYRTETLQTLADYYYASVFAGEMGSEEYNNVLRDWLDYETGGLLKEQSSQASLDPSTALALATTVYFKAKWANEFDKNATDTGIFHGSAGDKECEYMHSSGGNTVFEGDRFHALSCNFNNNPSMCFILPDEGVSIDELLSDSSMLDFITTSNIYGWADQKYLKVNLSVPKFDVSSDLNLKEAFASMGINSVFDENEANFKPITDSGVFLTDASHAARVRIDEEGCEAAAFTLLMTGAGGPPEEEMDFVLDRPFIFVIKGRTGDVLFAGIVNNAE